tara:strand:+ start:681 stop:1094 length:414 start_codon:yes stop_codon:yes gene_type:complete
MKLTTLTIAFALILCTPVSAQEKQATTRLQANAAAAQADPRSSAGERTVALAHEVTLSSLRLPQSESGTVGFKSCDSCAFRAGRVSDQTRWLLNGKSVSLVDFRASLARVADRNEVYVAVLEDLDDKRITEVSVYLQ